MRPTVEIAIPVHNEEAALEGSVRRLYDFCAESLPYSFRIVIADNASEDGTGAIGQRLAADLDAVTYVRLTEKGRGRALRRVWSRSDAAVLAYMDVDLSTGLEALLADDHWRARGEAAREYVLAYYETSRSRDRHLDLYRQLLDHC